MAKYEFKILHERERVRVDRLLYKYLTFASIIGPLSHDRLPLQTFYHTLGSCHAIRNPRAAQGRSQILEQVQMAIA